MDSGELKAFAARMKGRFETLSRDISENGGIEKLPRRALRLAVRMARNPRAVAGFGKAVARTWRGDGASAAFHRVRYELKQSRLPQSYRRWVELNDTLTDEDRASIRARVEKLGYRPLISILLPLGGPHDFTEDRLRRCVESVRSQLYPDWELCIVNEAWVGPRTRELLEEYQRADARIHLVHHDKPGTLARASNAALEMSRGEYVALLDAGDELRSHALYCVAEELDGHPEADFVYSDEDRLDAGGHRASPRFKCDWNPDLFLSGDSVSHLNVLRASVMKGIGGFREGFEGAEAYDLRLRFIEQIPERHVRHIPRVLYHGVSPVRDSASSRAAARRAIQEHLERRGIKASCAEGLMGTHRVRYELPDPAPKASILIPTRDRGDLVDQAVTSILERTDYPDYEILIIDNGSTEEASLETFKRLSNDARVRVLRYDHPFNFSAINNFGAHKANGDVLCLVNNDIEVISREWLREMVSHAMRPEVGAVGAKLYFPDRTIQHAGVVLGIVGGVAEHGHRRFPADEAGYLKRTHVVQRYAAVTGACLAVRRSVYEELGGLDASHLAVAYNDIDFCLRLREKGYAVVWTPYAELFHHESASRGSDLAADKRPRAMKEVAYMRERWGDLLLNDPYYSPNLTLTNQDFGYAFPSRAVKPWSKKE